jgi:hypothetical protein
LIRGDSGGGLPFRLPSLYGSIIPQMAQKVNPFFEFLCFAQKHCTLLKTFVQVAAAPLFALAL